MAVLRARATRFDLGELFARAATPRRSYLLLAFVAAGYSLGVSLPLALAHARAMPEPFLRIPSDEYFLWGTFFYGPVIIAAWLLAASVMHLVGRALGGRSAFDDLLRYAAFGRDSPRWGHCLQTWSPRRFAPSA
jgi:hypothetical protein